MTRSTGILFVLLAPVLALAQGGQQQVRAKADQLFAEQRFAEAMPLYSQLVSLEPGDRTLNYRFGACLLYGTADKEKAIGYLKYATEAPDTEPFAWYWMGRAYHLNYRFKEAQAAYQRFLGTADKKLLAAWPVEALQKQCRNGEKLLSSLKDITVRSKVEVDDGEFFRFYDLSDIGGRLVVLPDELKTSLDKKRKHRSLVYLPTGHAPIYFSSYGRDGATGLDIYRTELLPDGTYATPVKLAGYINTDQDEDYPFMHPDGRTFYFCSKGHNSMGGYDVFRASYDKGLDAFGRPENLDFAISTPDDDILYIVDAEQKEACFASGRNSKQGMLHVYRVATAQAPVMITVFKGTYASAFDADDRKARIRVEDMLTQEQVADVRTDINGNYVLSVPRAGRYRYRVECGPTGKTHGGVVDVPKADGPRAYRQELVLERNGDLEQLVIRNYFDDPLGDDLIALSLDEIKRRARLDVSTQEPVPAPEPVVAQAGDVLTRAGFTGDVDEARARQLAKEEASQAEARAVDQQAMAAEAFALALDAAQEAEKAAAKAEELVAQAKARDAEDAQGHALMAEAAAQRQRAREAALRARAARNAGAAIGASATAARQDAAEAAKLGTDLAAAFNAKQDDRTLPLLKELKERLDRRAKGGAAGDPDGQARQQLAEAEKEAARLMGVASAKRREEDEAADQVARLKREQDQARSRARKEELGRSITELEQQRAYLAQETQAAVRKAEAAERQTAAARGQASLTLHLTRTAERGPGNELAPDQVEQLGLRISRADQRNEAIAIDERFDAALRAELPQAEARAFDWDLASAAQAIGEPRAATQAMERSRTGDAQHAEAREVPVPQGAEGDRALHQAEERTVPESREDAVAQTVADAAANGRSVPAGNAATSRSEGQAGSAIGEGRDGDAPRTNAAQAADAQRAPDAVQARAGNQTGQAAAGGADRRFILENQRAELVQMASAERDRAKRAELQGRIDAIDAEAARAEAVTPATGEEPAAEADMSRPVLAFLPSAPDEEVEARLYRDYAADIQRAERLPDADARADAINGIELMMADSLRAEMQRQVAVLQMAPQQAETVLPRVDRLRRMREEHLARGEQAIAQRQQQVDAERPAATGAAPAAGTVSEAAPAGDPFTDRYVAIDRYAANVFASKVEHRSRAKGMDDAIAFRDADLARIEGLTLRIDTMADRLAEMPGGKEADKLRRKMVQLIDERYIIRTDLGQRSAFLMREEWAAAADSLKEMEVRTARKGVAQDEPLAAMAKEFAAEGKRLFDGAAQLRKRADRSEDIVLRDSLYRQAYRSELLALQAADKAITVQNRLASDGHRRGEQLTYEQVAALVLGSGQDGQEQLAQRAAPQAGADAAVQERIQGQAAAPPQQTERSGTDDVGPQADRGQAHASSAPPQEGREAVAQAAAKDGVQAQGQPGSQHAVPEAQAAVQQPGGTGAPERQSQAAAGGPDELIARTEQRLKEQDRIPAHLYERFMSTEPAAIAPMRMDPGTDPDLIAIRAEGKAREAQALEQRSQEAADRATALADSAATARKRDRERLQVLAVRQRALSDSLHSASLKAGAEGEELRRMGAEAEAAAKQRERLAKFYYLSADEMSMTLMDGDASRFFQAKARALEQAQAADDATSAAQSHREVATVLRQQARAAERDAVEGRLPAAEAADRALRLDARAVQMEMRADSLENVASRLRGAAGINEAQAGAMLQGMAPERSSELMALEQRARRQDALLAQARGQAAPAPARSAAAEAPPARIAGVGQPERQRTAQPAAGQAQSAEQASAMADAVRPPSAADRSPAAADAPGALPFRMPDELVDDIFEMNAPTARREEPIPIDAPLPAGIVFKVQIGAFRKPVPQQAFSGMAPVMGETVGNGLVRYTAGLFTGFEGAAAAKDLVRERGYRDAFVVAFRDGQRIPLGEAMRAAQQAQAVAHPRAAAEEPAPRGVAEAMPAAAPTAAVIAPLPAPAQPQAEDAAAILARYPATAQAILDSYAPAAGATSYYDVPGAAPAAQVEAIKGLFFTVQVGVYSRPVPLDKLFGITPLNSELTEAAKVRYTTGRYHSLDAARARKDDAVQLGVKDAFITAYLNGRRIPVREASALLQEHGPAILAAP